MSTNTNKIASNVIQNVKNQLSTVNKPSKISNISTWIIWVLLIIAIFLGIFGILGFMNSLKNADVNKQLYENNQKSLKNIPKCRQGPPGEPGPAGIPGPQGPAGGVFTQRGVLRNLQYTDLVSERFFNNTSPYLTKQNYSTSQLWTLNSKNFLQNQYKGCLTANPTTGTITMDTCEGGNEQNKNWAYSAEGLIRLMNTSKCLSVSPQNVPVGTNGIQNGGEMKVLTDKTLPQFTLVNCERTNNIPASQRWSFI